MQGFQRSAGCGSGGLGHERRHSGQPVPRLERDTTPESTFRHVARELLALSAFRANDIAAARQWLDQISADADTPPSLRSRAQALQGLLPPVAKS